MTDKKKRKESQPAEQAPQGTPTPTEIDKIAITIEEYDTLQHDLQDNQAKVKDLTDSWARERADFQNYRRMVERDQVQSAQNLKGEIIKKYLPIVDDLELALKTRPQEGDASSWANGIELIYRKLQNILETEGVQKVAEEGQAFDPNHHQAITHEASPDHQSGTIIEVVRQGYVVGERVLRPALVRVAN